MLSWVKRVTLALARAGRSTASGTKRAGMATARGGKRFGLATASGAQRVGHATRRLTHAQGAGRTGLGRLIELTAVNSVGDSLITLALAGTIFFGLPVNEARGQVALYLMITMIPFAVVAPFVGPVLDRFRSGRRYVMAGTLFARGLLCFAMAAAVGPGDVLTLFAGALGVLVLSKAYHVSRAAIMPSVLPADITLVSANARVALFSLVAAGVAVPIAAGLTAWLGAAWVLRIAMVVFLLLGVVAVRLPRHVDSPDLEEEEQERPGRRARWRTLLDVGPAVTEAVRANAAIRFFSGFLLFFLLFLVQDGHLKDLPATTTIAVLAAAAGLGGLVGAATANWARNHSPQLIVLLTLAVTLVTAGVTAYLFGLWAAVAVALVAAFAQELGKLALDAIVQREIGEKVRSSTFGVVEALLQLAWVFGGLVGLLVSDWSVGPGGLASVAVVLAVTLGWLLVLRRARVKARDAKLHAAQASRPEEPQDPQDPQDMRQDPHQDSRHDQASRPRKPHEPQQAQPPAPATTKPLTNPHG